MNTAHYRATLDSHCVIFVSNKASIGNVKTKQSAIVKANTEASSLRRPLFYGKAR